MAAAQPRVPSPGRRRGTAAAGAGKRLDHGEGWKQPNSSPSYGHSWLGKEPSPPRPGGSRRNPGPEPLPGAQGKGSAPHPEPGTAPGALQAPPRQGLSPLFGRRSGGCSPGPCARLGGRGRPVGRGERSEVQERSCGTQGWSRGMRGEVRDAGMTPWGAGMVPRDAGGSRAEAPRLRDTPGPAGRGRPPPSVPWRGPGCGAGIGAGSERDQLQSAMSRCCRRRWREADVGTSILRHDMARGWVVYARLGTEGRGRTEGHARTPHKRPRPRSSDSNNKNVPKSSPSPALPPPPPSPSQGREGKAAEAVLRTRFPSPGICSCLQPMFLRGFFHS